MRKHRVASFYLSEGKEIEVWLDRMSSEGFRLTHAVGVASARRAADVGQDLSRVCFVVESDDDG